MSFLEILILFLALHYFVFIFSIAKGIINVKKEVCCFNIAPPVSIVIVFRNEEDNLSELVHSINMLNYDKKNLEVIFVNDASEDDSVNVISGLINLSNYRIENLSLKNHISAFKKHAIEQAVDSANGEIIFLTDADCTVPPNWITATLKSFSDNTALVTGPVTFRENSTFFEKLQKLEFAGLNLTGAGLIGKGSPKIASSANLAFRKKVFKEVNGYGGLKHLSSGDDELLIQKIHSSTPFQVKYCFDKEALVETKGNESLPQFFNQRKRWASKSLFYNDKLFIFRLILIALFYISLPASLITGLVFSSNYLAIFFASILLKTIPEYFVMYNGSGLLFDKSLLKLFPAAQLFQIPYIIVSSVTGLFGNFSWKGRKLKR